MNLGDAMVKFSAGILRSNIHRVVSPPGQQADHTRFSLVYFARPEYDVLMERLEGSEKIPELDEEAKRDAEKMKIAWRYERLGQTGERGALAFVVCSINKALLSFPSPP